MAQRQYDWRLTNVCRLNIAMKHTEPAEQRMIRADELAINRREIAREESGGIGSLQQPRLAGPVCYSYQAM